MKLPDFTHFEPFQVLRNKMRAFNLGSYTLDFKPTILTDLDWKELYGDGKEIDIKDLRTLPDGTLAWKNARVLLYIRDIASYSNKSYDDSLPKFHIAGCSTLEKMKGQNRFERYVVSTRTNGEFKIQKISKYSSTKSHRESLEKLNVCKPCLLRLSYKGYSSHQKSQSIYSNFELKEFFNSYPAAIITDKPTHTDATAPTNTYSGDFEQISLALKQRKNWSCEECRVNLSKPELKKFLHTHHKNGLKYDNSDGNLEVMCIKCHADEAMHDHMTKLPDYYEFIGIYSSLRLS